MNYQWTTSNGTIAGSANSATVSVSAEGIYTVLVTDLSNGCSSSESVAVFSNNVFNFDLSSLSFPNIITINTDSRNEEWKPFLASDPEQNITNIFIEFTLKVYDRWGLIFQNEEDDRTWKPTDIHSGTYYYVVEYKTVCGSGAVGKKEGYIEVISK